jgi:hypothetical protein
MQFDVTIQYGLAGSRNKNLQVSENEILRNVALRFAEHFQGELDSTEFKLVTTKVLNLSKTVAQNDLAAGAIVTAVMGGWKVKLKGQKKHKCSCWWHHNCGGCVYGPNVEVNKNAVRPLFRIGGRTCLYELFVLSDEHEEAKWVTGNANTWNFLRKNAHYEWLWQCCKCETIRFTVSDECEPHDTRYPWQTRGDSVFCSMCAWTNTV